MEGAAGQNLLLVASGHVTLASRGQDDLHGYLATRLLKKKFGEFWVLKLGPVHAR